MSEKKIIIRLAGGMGNQMFQYAAALSLSTDMGATLLIDTSLLGKETRGYDDTVRHFELAQLFKGPFKKADFWDCTALYPLSSSFFHRLAHKLLGGFVKAELIVQRSYDKIELTPGRMNLMGIVGRFQSQDYFKNHEAKVLDAFRIKLPDSEKLRVLLETIRSESTVGIHVRRGDYVTHPGYSKSIGFVGESYLNAAMSYATEKLETKPKFVVVSDDHDWCRSFFGEDVFIVSETFLPNPAHSDFLILSNFRNLIISNSTFAWWAAKIGEANSQLIIAPKKWAKSGSFDQRIIPENWIAL